MGAALAVTGFILFIIYGGFQIYAGYIGIAHHFGSTWAWIAIALTFIFRLTLPITIGSFFCAMNVWGWHWAAAAVFSAPGLALVIPGVLASIFATIKEHRK